MTSTPPQPPSTASTPTAAPDDAEILLTRGKYAYFTSDFEMARLASEEAQSLVLAGERNWQVLDLVALQGMLAHRSGGWFDRMRLELRRTRETPEIANAIFDGYLCPAEYMLYGQASYCGGDQPRPRPAGRRPGAAVRSVRPRSRRR